MLAQCPGEAQRRRCRLEMGLSQVQSLRVLIVDRVHMARDRNAAVSRNYVKLPGALEIASPPDERSPYFHRTRGEPVPRHAFHSSRAAHFLHRDARHRALGRISAEVLQLRLPGKLTAKRSHLGAPQHYFVQPQLHRGLHSDAADPDSVLIDHQPLANHIARHQQAVRGCISELPGKRHMSAFRLGHIQRLGQFGQFPFRLHINCNARIPQVINLPAEVHYGFRHAQPATLEVNPRLLQHDLAFHVKPKCDSLGRLDAQVVHCE